MDMSGDFTLAEYQRCLVSQAVRRLRAMSKEEQLAYGYGMSPATLRKLKRKKWWLKVWKWVFRVAICFAALC